jgi:acyl carrier protein
MPGSLPHWRPPCAQRAWRPVASRPHLEFVLSALPSSSNASTVAAQSPEALEADLAALFVRSLNLEMTAAEIEPTAPLFGDGLGLDSIDILEVALEISQQYGFQLRSDDDNNQKIFQNLRSLAVHVAQHRTK